MPLTRKFRLAVDKKVLLLLAGVLWICVGVMLLVLAYSWLRVVPRQQTAVCAGIGVVAALLIHHLGFLKVVDKNLRRISPMEGKQSAFAFMSWKSYLVAAGMAGMGYLLRHSGIPKPYLSVIYIAIGLALVLSSVRYMRVLAGQLRNR